MRKLSSANNAKLFHLIERFAPPVARGLALGFAVLAVATAVFGMGDYASAAERYWVSAAYGLVAVVSLVVSRAVEPFLRWLNG